MKKVTKINKIYKQQDIQRILDAKKSYSKMLKEIAPFVRIRKFKSYSTIGQWDETSNICQ